MAGDSVQFAYTQSLLTSVALTYGTLSYYPNLLVSQVVHRNGVIETQGNDPNEIRRPSSLAATGPFPGWSSGAYAYDGAGNIKTIGTASFTYDAVNRLVGSTQYDGPMGTGTPKQQGYTFDAFGNLTSITGTSGRNTPTDPQTNRMNGSAMTTYDAAGNLTGWNGATYQYDEFNQMVRMQSPPENWAYLYTADDERLWSYDLGRNLSHWTVRDLGAKVLRDYLNNGGTWSVATDYIYRDGLLLAAETQTGQRHFHLDHLGTPRLITRAGGEKVAYHVYYPFGEEATVYNQDTERMKFTGHERDLANPSGPGDDLDYMHARHESPVTGRFLSVDSAESDPKFPQSWNRDVYTRDNPLVAIDPDGLEIQIIAYSPGFKASVEGALINDERATPRLKTAIQGLRNSAHVHIIREADTTNGENQADSQEDASNGKGTGSKTYMGLYGIDEEGNTMTLDEVLAHEVSHMEDADTGTRSEKVDCVNCATRKEVKAVQMQNQLRPDNPRTHFGELLVPKPTATPKDPRKTQKKKTPQKGAQ